jgi:hypothetical protein
MNRLKEQKKQKAGWHKITLYDIIRTLSERRFRKNKPIKDDEGEKLVTKEQQLKRWEEYFSGIVNKDKYK